MGGGSADGGNEVFVADFEFDCDGGDYVAVVEKTWDECSRPENIENVKVAADREMTYDKSVVGWEAIRDMFQLR